MDAQFVKSLLESSEIRAFLKDANMGSIAPWFTSPGGAGAVKVMISSDVYDAAKTIVDEFERNRN